MKISRVRPSDWKHIPTETDCKLPKDYIASYVAFGCIKMDGTINKKGDRHTQIVIDVDADDVVALVGGMKNRLQNRIDELEVELKELRDYYTGVFRKLEKIASDDPPEVVQKQRLEDRLEAVRSVCEYFSSSNTSDFDFDNPVLYTSADWFDLKAWDQL